MEPKSELPPERREAEIPPERKAELRGIAIGLASQFPKDRAEARFMLQSLEEWLGFNQSGEWWSSHTKT